MLLYYFDGVYHYRITQVRAVGHCVRPIIMRWLAEVVSKIVKLSGAASCEQGAS